jgi:hypothetical protein
MLFRFAAPQDGTSTMKNTLVPLSIAFADSEGVIQTILDMEPCESNPCPSYRPDAPYMYALEVNRGAFRSTDVVEGWQLGIPSDLQPPPARPPCSPPRTSARSRAADALLMSCMETEHQAFRPL